MSSGALDRFGRDVALSEAQAAILSRSHEAYVAGVDEAVARASASLDDWYTTYWYKRMPELDPDADLTGVDARRLVEIAQMRNDVKGGRAPIEDAGREYYSAARAALSATTQRALKDERALRATMLASIEPLLADAQLAHLDRARTRLEIALHAEPLHEGTARREPVWRINMLALLEEAAKVEFSPFDAAVNDSPHHDSDRTRPDDLLAVLRAFETQYRDAMHAHALKWLKHGDEAIARRDAGDRAGERAALERMRGLEQDVWRLRVKLIKDVAGMALTSVGETAAAAWSQRAFAACAPATFASKPVDDLLKRIKNLELPADERLAIESICVDFQNRRNARREEVVQAIIAKSCEVHLNADPSPAPAAQRLAEAQTVLASLEAKWFKSLQDLVPVEHRQSLNVEAAATQGSRRSGSSDVEGDR